MEKLITRPVLEPITTPQVIAHLGIADQAEGEYLQSLIMAARDMVERHTGRALMIQTWETTLDPHRCDGMALSKTPVIKIESVTYTDADGAESLITDYFVDWSAPQPRLIPARGASWPDTADGAGRIVVRYVAGFGDVDDVPPSIKQAMLMQIADWHHRRAPSIRSEMDEDGRAFTYRDGGIAEPITAMLTPFRVIGVA